MKCYLLLVVIALSIASSANAAIQVEVDARSRPWEVVPGGLNDDLSFGDPFSYGLSPKSVTDGFDFTAGGLFSFTYISGLTTPYGPDPNGIPDPPYATGKGDPAADVSQDPFFGIGNSGQPFPSFYIPSGGPTPFLNALVGTFADASGKIVGTPFIIGDGLNNVASPFGATQILLGFNDDLFDDNSGSLIVSVAGPSAVPEPAAIVAWTLLGVPAIAFRALRRRRSC